MTKKLSRRAFMATSAGTLFTLASPHIIHAQNLSHNDIWTKTPKTPLKKGLTLCFDRSGSMQSDELHIQRTGTAQALDHPNTHYTITTPDGEGNIGIAISSLSFAHDAAAITASGRYSYAAGKDTFFPNSQFWAVLETDADIAQYRDFILSYAPISSTGGTNIIDALHTSALLHDNCPHHVLKRTCDVSGDGIQSAGLYELAEDKTILATIRAEALLAKSTQLARRGISVNAFAMVAGKADVDPMLVDGALVTPRLDEYYKRYLQSPPNIEALDYQPGFTIPVVKNGTFRESYPAGMTRKLILELA